MRSAQVLPPSRLKPVGEGNHPSGSATPAAAQQRQREKGSRQTFSCAECKRLKLKCNRVWPCTSCEKRGCAQICPNGEMRTGKGKRLILADTEELHQRISLLEVALAQSHANTSTKPHPLLRSTYLFSSQDPRAEPDGVLDGEEEDMVDGAYGTLTIGAEGEARFVGSFAGSEYLREGEDRNGESPEEQVEASISLRTPPAAARKEWHEHTQALHLEARPANGGLPLDAILPYGRGDSVDIESLREQLPDWCLEGRVLVESYWYNVNWMYQILPRPMFDNDHLLNAYDIKATPNPHKLACVFLLMAVGAMFDLNRLPYGNGAELFWPILGSAVKIAQSLGLHRDGEAFGLSTYEVQERRQVWWEVVTYDRLQALCFGRPCATSNRSSDTKLPEAAEPLIADKDGYHRAKYQLIQMMEKVIDVQTQTSPVPYALVTQLDSEIREFTHTIPESLLPKVPIQDLPFDRSYHPHLVIHRLGIRLLVAQTRLLLNRPSFTRTLQDKPEDPSRSKFGGSFVALYESAQEIVQLVKQLVIYHPSLVARWWFFWFHAFSSAVCLSAIAIRAPECAFASPAFHGMSIVCDISAAAREGCRAKKGLPTLLRLRRRAHEALVSASRTNARSITTLSSLSSSVDDLSHLVSVAKLRRVAYSPPQKQASSGSDLSGMISWQGEAPFSPNSQESLATSATLAENLSYDPITGLAFDQPTFTGIVPPPPAPENVWYMPDSPQSVGNVSYGQLTDARGQGVSAMGMDTSTAYEYGFGSGNEESGVTNGMELNGDGGDGGMGFDFEAFVNQVGMGGMGLIG